MHKFASPTLTLPSTRGLALVTALLAGCAHPVATDHAGMDHSRLDHAAHARARADTQRLADVSARGGAVMPFSLAATEHVFTKSSSGGVQQVVARNAEDARQVALVRLHLSEIREQFLKGDFSGPSHIHGADMPGLAVLKTAQPGQLVIAYREIPAGAELRYTTTEAHLIVALHQWFDAQLTDHGPDARGGHAHQENRDKR